MCDVSLTLAFRLLDGELTPQEQERLRLHASRCEECAENLRRAEGVRKLGQSARAEVPQVDWVRVRANVDRVVEDSGHGRSAWLVLPAVVGLAAMAAVALWPSEGRREATPTRSIVETETISSADGGTRIALADGSTLEVPQGARVELASNSADRIAVRLVEGAVTAEVTKRPARREFVVMAGAVSVRVLGTRFTVSMSGPKTVDVAVAHGRVQVTGGGGEVSYLAAGEQGSFGSESSTALLERAIALEDQAKAAEQQRRSEEAASATAPNAAVSDEEPASVADQERSKDARAVATTEKPAREDKEQEPVRSVHSEPKAKTAEPTQRKVAADMPDPASDATKTPSEHVAGATRVPVPPAGGASIAESTEVVTVEPEAEIEVTSVTATPLEDAGRREVLQLFEQVREGHCISTLPRLDRFLATHKGHRNFGDALYLEGYCQVALGNRDRGLKTWKRYMALEPNGAWLRSVGDFTEPTLPDSRNIR